MSLSPKKQQIAALFDGFAAEKNRWAGRANAYYRYLAKLVGKLVPEAKRVLELGSGSGDLLHALSPSAGVGVDISPGMVALAQSRHPDLHFLVADVESLEMSETFDTAIAVNLVGVLEDVYACFQRTRALLHPRGRFVIVYYNLLWEPVLRLASSLKLRAPVPLENWLPLPDIENLLSLTGYEVVRRGRRMLCPKFVPLLSWFLNTCIAPLPLINRLCLIEYVVARPVPALGPNSGRNLSCSIIIPTKDEKGNIEAAITRTQALGSHTEFIFIDGHSTDGTVEEIARVMKAYPDRDIRFAFQEGRGKADAVRKGFDMAAGDVLMILDSDLTMPPEDLPKYFEVIASGRAEFVNGCRLVYPMEKEAMRFLNKIANHIFGWLFSWLMEQRVRDTLCGTKVLFRKDYERIAANRAYFGDFDPFGDFDLLFGAARLNLKIADLPIRYRERTYGEIKISRFRHGLLLLKMSVFAARKLKFF
jgi:SAM-dependent methyltransferase